MKAHSKKLGVIAFLLLSALKLWGAPQTNGPVASMVIATNPVGNLSYIFRLSPTGVVSVTAFAPDVIEVRFHWDSLWEKEEVGIAKPFNEWPYCPVTFSNLTTTSSVLHTTALTIEIILSPRFNLRFRSPSGLILLETLRMEYDWDYHPMNDSSYQLVDWGGSWSVGQLPNGFKLRATMVMPQNEAYFGLGEYPGPLNRRGRNIQGWNQDTYYWQEFRNPMYMTMPLLYGLRPPTATSPPVAYGLFFNNPSRPTFRLGTVWTNAYSFEAGDGQLHYFFFGGGTGHTALAILDRFTELTGRPARMPKWAFGYHHSRHSYYAQHQVHTLIQGFRSRGIPLDAVYLDIGTQSNTCQMTFNPSYTNVPGLIQFAASHGVKLIPLIEPLLKTTDPLYWTALTNLYFLKANDLSTYVGQNFLGSISWLDFSITETRNWWKQRMLSYLSQFPFAGIWNDLNEPNENAMPLNIVYYCDGRYGGGTNNADSRKWHQVNKNTFNVRQTSLTFDTLRTFRPNSRPFVLSRAGWPGVQAYAAGWSGDNTASWDHLRHNIPLGVSVMISGQAMFGHDIGGFIGHPSDELMMRWVQWGVFNPFARAHSMETGETPDRPPWAFSSPHYEIMRDAIRLRYQLMPYLYSLAHRCSTQGVPMNLPTLFVFPQDANLYRTNNPNDYDFMVGESLLVAPVLTAGAVERAIYLPTGAVWYSWGHDQRYAGGQTVTVAVSLATTPLFVRQGAIIPMGPWMNYADEFSPTYLDVHVWPAGDARFDLYEDDGWSTNYLAGQYALTRFSASTSAGGFAFSVAAREGSYSPGQRDWFIIAHDAPPVAGVVLDGVSVNRVGPGAIRTNSPPAWSYDAVVRQLTVKFADDGAAHTLAATFAAEAPAGPPAYTSAYFSMSVAATFNHWNPCARNMRLVDHRTWAAVLALPTTNRVEFKFAANDSWAVNWGDNDQGDFSIPMSGAGEAAGANIAATQVVAGLYTFRFNEQTRQYSVVRAAAADSDADGMDDAWEVFHGFQPHNPNDAAFDESRSGLSNLQEYIAGTDPLDAARTFRLSAPETTVVNAIQFKWPAASGRVYRVWFTTNDLVGMPAWTLLTTLTNVSGASELSVTHSNAVMSRAVYRIGVHRP